MDIKVSNERWEDNKRNKEDQWILRTCWNACNSFRLYFLFGFFCNCVIGQGDKIAVISHWVFRGLKTWGMQRGNLEEFSQDIFSRHTRWQIHTHTYTYTHTHIHTHTHSHTHVRFERHILVIGIYLLN